MITEQAYNPDLERRERFALLRKEAFERAKRDTEERLKTNPNPTEEELEIGLYYEQLEPQVRDTVFDCNRKGYQTFMSGFNGRDPEKQFVNFNEGYEIPAEAQKALEGVGVRVYKRKLELEGRGEIQEIEFSPNEPDLDKIKLQWDSIRALIPDSGHKAPQNQGATAVEFRKKHVTNS